MYSSHGFIGTPEPVKRSPSHRMVMLYFVRLPLRPAARLPLWGWPRILTNKGVGVAENFDKQRSAPVLLMRSWLKSSVLGIICSSELTHAVALVGDQPLARQREWNLFFSVCHRFFDNFWWRSIGGQHAFNCI